MINSTYQQTRTRTMSRHRVLSIPDQWYLSSMHYSSAEYGRHHATSLNSPKQWLHTSSIPDLSLTTHLSFWWNQSSLWDWIQLARQFQTRRISFQLRSYLSSRDPARRPNPKLSSRRVSFRFKGLGNISNYPADVHSSCFFNCYERYGMMIYAQHEFNSINNWKMFVVEDYEIGMEESLSYSRFRFLHHLLLLGRSRWCFLWRTLQKERWMDGWKCLSFIHTHY